ncbi:MAG: DegV family protein [Ruminococcaceae bacterium]|nr:DegV family protein [Oscillospiraceae bacterium]
MRDYVILTDSGTDLSAEMAKQLDIEILDLMVIMENEEPRPNSSVETKEFYKFLSEKHMATTSAVNSETFAEVMEKIVTDGKDVIYLGFSSGLSNTYNAGRLAAEEIAEKHPEAKVYAVDTLCASLGEGMLVYLAAKKKQAGATIDELRDYVEANKLHLCHWFTVEDLMFLKRGGRVSAATAVVGTMLSIKPVMHVDNAGKLIKMGTARGRKASVDALFEKTKANAIEKDIMFICHGDCIDDANYLADRLKNELGVKEVIIDYTGVVIGSHSGPGTLAVFYIGTER